MDVLSDVLAVLQTGRPFAGRFNRTGPWSNHHRSHPDAFGVQIVLRGGAVVTTEAGTTFKLDEGDVLVLPRGSAHTVADSPDAPPGPPCTAGDERAGVVLRSAEDPDATHVSLCLAYEMAPGRTHPMLAAIPDFVRLPADAAARPELAGAIAMLDGELRAERSGGDTLVTALLDAVLMYLLRAMLEGQARHCGFDGWAAALADRSVGAALQAVHAEPERQWSVASLGEVAGLSRSAFSRRFTELVGQPPLAYLTSWRLTLAARLLADTDAPLATVARRVGYASEFAFAAAFKRDFGQPPGRFRKRTPACEAAPEAVFRPEPARAA
ncbi:AraC family transcriptional regulator [Glycomyces sp. TRM65418]|uniref:AraC family transcriptional regulator n=1 Tax=Glycomyces sp. TRM65418 TaxID=2867006 RepID=UPI001CE6B8BC|nr:AraC family transcriptional regulator [Glycomyces sp. TRM65418]MCC3765778.1 AraC family transcriptional regulator [Glycomyces sp. TRM65418]QZD55368.1 AraC family transcriptional regulator [Glycomyces sp. TRM65418]